MSKLLFVSILAAMLISFTACTPLQNEPGSVEVHFCPQEDCANIFAAQLAKAKVSLNCALYDIDGNESWQAIDKAAKRIPVRIVMDNDYKKEALNRTFVKFDTKSGLMHNKFCIIDNKIVTTGSMNPTYNDIHKNFNNLIIINASGIANNYETEFEELWAGQFRKGTTNAKTQFLINGTYIEQYFCPEDSCEKQVINSIHEANESIKFMTFSFTSMPIAVALIEAKDRGIKVEGLYEKSQVNAYSIYEMLTQQGISAIKAKSTTAGKLHHKVFIIDNQTVIAGSYNPSKNGNQGNDENLIIIHNREMASSFSINYQYISSIS